MRVAKRNTQCLASNFASDTRVPASLDFAEARRALTKFSFQWVIPFLEEAMLAQSEVFKFGVSDSLWMKRAIITNLPQEAQA